MAEPVRGLSTMPAISVACEPPAERTQPNVGLDSRSAAVSAVSREADRKASPQKGLALHHARYFNSFRCIRRLSRHDRLMRSHTSALTRSGALPIFFMLLLSPLSRPLPRRRCNPRIIFT